MEDCANERAGDQDCRHDPTSSPRRFPGSVRFLVAGWLVGSCVFPFVVGCKTKPAQLPSQVGDCPLNLRSPELMASAVYESDSLGPLSQTPRCLSFSSSSCPGLRSCRCLLAILLCCLLLLTTLLVTVSICTYF